MDALLALENRSLAVDLVSGRATEHHAGYRAESIAVTDGSVLVGTFDDGLWRAAHDGGALGEFERVGPETLPERVTALAVAPSDPEVVYLGAEPSAVYRSDDGGEPSAARRVSSGERSESDGGETWHACASLTDLPSADQWSFPPRPDTHHVRTLAVHPEDPARLYVGIEAGAFVRSAESGDSWTERPPGSRRDNHALATHPAASTRPRATATRNPGMRVLRGTTRPTASGTATSGGWP